MMNETSMHFASPLAPDAPCGPNLEYDPRLIALEESFAGKPEQQMGDAVISATPPNWKRIEKDAAALMEETRDIRIVVFWTAARLANAGLSGLREGLEIIRSLSEGMWEELWPVPDEGDVQERISALARLSPLPGSFDADMAVIQLLNDTELCSSPTMGSYRLRDIREAQDGSRMKVMRAALQDTPGEWVDSFRQDLDGVQQCLKGIRDCFMGHGQGTPDFRMVADILKEMQLFFDAQPVSAGMPEAVADDAEPETPGHFPAAVERRSTAAAVPPSAGTVAGRRDAVRCMQELCRWFEENEPSSPAPYFLKRAIRSVGANLMDILADIAPHLQEQARAVLKPEGPAEAGRPPEVHAAPAVPPASGTTGQEYANPFG